MPELPDVVVYIEHLARRLVGERLARVRLASPFVLRTVDPPLTQAEGRQVAAVGRIGKQIVLDLEADLHLVLHLMIAGRLRWRDAGASIRGRNTLAAFDFARGTLLLTEASSRKRAALHLVRGRQALAAFERGGREPLDINLPTFSAALTHENHTLKRSLTDPRILAGIGNAYSDEILHRARLSPMQLTRNLDAAAMERLYRATREVLRAWIARLREQSGERFPDKVTAFRPEMAVHGKFGRPCPTCGGAVQRIAYAENECNYCPRCQTGGRLLADRSLSRVLKGDWPRTLEELEERRRSP